MPRAREGISARVETCPEGRAGGLEARLVRLDERGRGRCTGWRQQAWTTLDGPGKGGDKEVKVPGETSVGSRLLGKGSLVRVGEAGWGGL